MDQGERLAKRVAELWSREPRWIDAALVEALNGLAGHYGHKVSQDIDWNAGGAGEVPPALDPEKP